MGLQLINACHADDGRSLWLLEDFGRIGGLNLGPFCQIGRCPVAVEVWEEVAIEVNSVNILIHR